MRGLFQRKGNSPDIRFRQCFHHPLNHHGLELGDRQTGGRLLPLPSLEDLQQNLASVPSYRGRSSRVHHLSRNLWLKQLGLQLKSNFRVLQNNYHIQRGLGLLRVLEV